MDTDRAPRACTVSELESFEASRHGAFTGDRSQVPYAKVLTPDKVRLDEIRPNVLCVASVEKSERPEDPSGVSPRSPS